MTDHADWVGRTVADGRFLITRKLGEGGMGFVYQANDNVLRTDVVIKVPRRSMLDDPEFKARFAQENQALVTLQHPNIVSILFVGEEGDLPYAVMQYLPGGDLKARQMKAGGGRIVPMHPGDLVHWLPGTAKALDFIHARGFIHRDVKPANILFDGYDNVYLSDFGVAKAVAEKQTNPATQLTGTGMVMGTPEYMAPELIMGDDVDGRIDQYALAISVYEVLCGRTPFEGAQSQAILVKQVNEAVPDLTSVASHISSALCQAVMQGLMKDPSDRYPDCGSFTKAVIAALESQTVAPSGQPTSPGKASASETKPVKGVTSPTPAPIVKTRKAVSPERRAKQMSLAALWGGLALLFLGFVLILPAMDAAPEDSAEDTPQELSDEEKLLAVPLASRKSELDFQNPLGMTLVCISPGRYTGETPQEQPSAILKEPFWISEAEVTVAQYFAFLEANADNEETLFPEWLNPESVHFLENPQSGYASHREIVQKNGVPITGLKVDQMMQFCAWLSARPGEAMNYQLPTREQWLCAYRAGSSTTYYWGDSYKPGQCVSAHGNPAASLGLAKSPMMNAWELSGMAGNVCEVLASQKDVAGGHWATTKPIEHSANSFRPIPVDLSLVGFRVVAVPK